MEVTSTKKPKDAPLLVWVVVSVSLAILAWTASEILAQRKDIVQIQTNRFTAKEGSEQAERIKVLEIKVNVINGIIRDIKAIRNDVQAMNNRLIRISTHMKIEDK